MPDPLTPPDCDLRGLPFMPLDVVRLTDSDLFALSTGDEFKAALTLWCKSWLQVPAASLPTDDRILAHLSGAGSKWRKVKAIALRGFIQCDDGRLYHPVIAEKANDAWERRGDWQEKQHNKNERQQRWRDKVKALYAELRDLGVTPPAGASLSTLEHLLVDAKASQPASTGDAREVALTGTGTGTVTPLSNDNGAAPDSDKQFWDAAKAYLRGETKNPGAVIGKWCRDHGKVETAGALTRAQLERPVEKIPFIEGCLRATKSPQVAVPIC